VESSVVAFEFLDDDTIIVSHVVEAGKRTAGPRDERWKRARGPLMPERAVPAAAASTGE